MKALAVTTKVLPFETKQGFVPGHEITKFQPEWMAKPIREVVFETFDQKAEMMVEIHVHWTEWTKYMKRKWPSGGNIKAVICEDGRRVYVNSWIVAYYCDEDYKAAPIICRDIYELHATNGTCLMTVNGVAEWASSDRSADATAKYIIDPWARDNDEFAKRN